MLQITADYARGSSGVPAEQILELVKK